SVLVTNASRRPKCACACNCAPAPRCMQVRRWCVPHEAPCSSNVQSPLEEKFEPSAGLEPNNAGGIAVQRSQSGSLPNFVMNVPLRSVAVNDSGEVKKALPVSSTFNVE